MHRFLLFDHDAKFRAEVVPAVRDMGSEPTRTAFRSPWQNGVAECWVGSCRRDLLDHVIIVNERHLKRLMSSYLLYYHEDWTHLGLAKDTPTSRPTAIRSARENKIQSFPGLGGLQIVMRWQRRFESHFLMIERFCLQPGRERSMSSERAFSPVDESACSPKPKSLRQTRRTPFNLGHNDLANDRCRICSIPRSGTNEAFAMGLCAAPQQQSERRNRDHFEPSQRPLIAEAFVQ
jgi:hypothetical protein